MLVELGGGILLWRIVSLLVSMLWHVCHFPTRPDRETSISLVGDDADGLYNL